MTRDLLVIAGGSAVYGASIGSFQGAQLASWNLAKFPMLLFVTALVCGPAFHAFALVLTDRLSLRAVAALSLGTYADLAVLLASFAPAVCFLARTAMVADADPLEAHRYFAGANVIVISVCGSLALVQRVRRLASAAALPVRTATAILFAWLGLSLVVGGQCAWFLRPYFGVPGVRYSEFIAGWCPGRHGATNFFETVGDLISPPRDDTRKGR